MLASTRRRLLAEALARALRCEPNDAFRLVGEPLHGGDAAVRACQQVRPDVLLLDLDGGSPSYTADLVRRIKSISPSTRLVLLLGSAPNEDALILDCIEAGADGLLDRGASFDDLTERLRMAASGAIVVPEEELVDVVRKGARERDTLRRATEILRSLTEREAEILNLIGEGHGNEEIARRLHISARTVASHVQNLYRKMNVHSRLQAVAVANRFGVLALQRSE